MRLCGSLVFVGTALFLGACAAPSPARSRAPGNPGAAAERDSGEAIGSTRNSRVAYAMPAGERAPLTFLSADLSDSERAELGAIAPNVRIVGGLNAESALAHAA